MVEIYDFIIDDATVSVNSDGSLAATFTYPSNPKALDVRLEENLDFGIDTLSQLISAHESRIATPQFPIKTPSGGSLYVTEDEHIICHRRDMGAKTHKMTHSAYGGFAQSFEDVMTSEGLVRLGLRETAEECLLVDRNDPRYLIVPEDSVKETLESARTIGLDLKPRYVVVENEPGSDTFEAKDEQGSTLFSMKTFFGLMYESSRSCQVYQLRRLPLCSDEVLPIDGEGMVRKDGTFNRFNREAYIIPISHIEKIRFGEPLDDFLVYQAIIRNGKPEFYSGPYNKPFYGPHDGSSKLVVTHPHLWAPENMLCDLLDAKKVPFFSGNKLRIELDKCERKKIGLNVLVRNEFIEGFV